MQTFGELGTLKNQGLASYKWGRYDISLSQLSAYYNRKYLIEAIAGLQSEVGIWNTPNEFRSFVSLFHEIVHYQQDISTGIGHWDYVVRNRFKKDILGDFRFYTYMDDQASAFQTEIQKKLDGFSKESIFNAYSFREERALEILASEIKDFENYQPGEEVNYTIPRLLELDAALNVFSAINKLNLTDKGNEIMRQHKEVFDPFYMTESYKELYMIFLSLSSHIFGINQNSQPEKVKAAFGFVEKATPLFIDIALAYPPPTYFENSDAQRTHFEPGLRLIRVLHAFQNIEVEPESNDSFLFLIDEATRRTTSFVYPSVKQIYEDWAEYFEHYDEDDPVCQWRKELCEQRALDPDDFAHRHIYNFILYDLPLFINMPGKTANYIYITRRILGSEGDELYWSLQANERDLSLIDLFLGLGNKLYCCPLASKSGSGICKAQEGKCLTGIKEIHELPHSADCIVRSSLASAGFNL